MEHIRLTAISLSLLLCTVSAFAQRHYENIPALELNYGTNLFGNAGNYYNLSFSRYINRTSYWKAGFSYFEKPYEYTANLPQVSTLNPEETIPETIHDKGKDFFVDGGHPDMEYNFIIGPKQETELEVFILPRTALLARIQQHWNPLSIDKWNTVWNVGIKILLY